MSKKKTITPNERLMLAGLLALGHRAVQKATEAEEAACEITREEMGGHTGDEMWSPRGDAPNVDDLLNRLGIEVEK